MRFLQSWIFDKRCCATGETGGEGTVIMNYKLLKKKGDLSTLRKVVTTDEKPNRKNLGVVGNVDDLQRVGILEQYNGPGGYYYDSETGLYCLNSRYYDL